MKKTLRPLFVTGLLSVIILFGTLVSYTNKNLEPKELATVENEQNFTDLKSRNESVLVKALMLNKWLSISDIHQSSYKQIRNTLVLNIINKTMVSKKELLKLSDIEISYVALAYRFMLESDLKSAESLKSMSTNDLNKTLIQLNIEQTSYTILTLQDFSIEKNLRIAYDWWLPKNNASLITEFKIIDNHQNDNITCFQVKDNHQRNTEVLRIVKVNEADFKYLGVYHSMVSKNHFELYLAGSNDLKNWKRINILGDRSHQGDIKKWGKGYIIANEEDLREGTNNIKITFYESYEKLCANQPKFSKSIKRTFSNFAEGTPDIREIIGDNPEDSYLLLGFHYYNNGDVDYQAMGILKDFKSWKAWTDDITNKNIIGMGFKGNIGGRYAFKNNNKEFILQEAQIKKADFSTWRILIGDGAFYTTLNLKTPNGSISFANPSILEIEKGNYIISSFLPSEGNKRGENGQLIYSNKIE